MLDLIKVSKTFHQGESFSVLKEISFSVKSGEFICLIGPSGCGKSVLISLIAGFLPVTSGDIFLDGNKIFGPSRERLVVFQNYSLFPWMTVEQNIAFGLTTMVLSLSEKEKLVSEFLVLMNLNDFKNWYVYKLSGGMQQRVALARALISDPKILLMDEPFAALDLQYRKFLRQNLIEIWQRAKKTIIFVTHSINEALELADTIYVLSANPATIKKFYKIQSLRPRDHNSEEFVQLSKQIENDLFEEFKKYDQKN